MKKLFTILVTFCVLFVAKSAFAQTPRTIEEGVNVGYRDAWFYAEPKGHWINGVIGTGSELVQFNGQTFLIESYRNGEVWEWYPSAPSAVYYDFMANNYKPGIQNAIDTNLNGEADYYRGILLGVDIVESQLRGGGGIIH